MIRYIPFAGTCTAWRQILLGNQTWWQAWCDHRWCASELNFVYLHAITRSASAAQLAMGKSTKNSSLQQNQRCLAWQHWQHCSCKYGSESALCYDSQIGFQQLEISDDQSCIIYKPAFPFVCGTHFDWHPLCCNSWYRTARMR